MHYWSFELSAPYISFSCIYPIKCQLWKDSYTPSSLLYAGSSVKKSHNNTHCYHDNGVSTAECPALMIHAFLVFHHLFPFASVLQIFTNFLKPLIQSPFLPPPSEELSFTQKSEASGSDSPELYSIPAINFSTCIPTPTSSSQVASILCPAVCFSSHIISVIPENVPFLL